MRPLRWDVIRPWRSMRGVPSGCRMIARNWYRVLNASIARTFPAKSSRERGSGVTMSVRMTPIALCGTTAPGKTLSSHLGRADAQVERVLSEDRLDHVRVVGCLGCEPHLEGVGLAEDHVAPRLEHAAEFRVPDDVQLDHAVLRELHLLAGVLHDAYDLPGVALGQEVLVEPGVQVDHAAFEGFLDHVLGHALHEGHHARIDTDLLALDAHGVLAPLEARLDLPGVLATKQDLDLLGPELVRR